MTVPLSRLYNFLDDNCDHDIVIYRFFPHGSKKIIDLSMLQSYTIQYCPDQATITNKFMICYDQEPLNFDLYNNSQTVDEFYAHHNHRGYFGVLPRETIDQYKESFSKLNLRLIYSGAIYHRDLMLLLHSEQRSQNLKQYEAIGFVGVYWWCHAVIARDWFRYAEVDTLLSQRNKETSHDFLIYNRAWTGTREYRLKFVEMLIQNNLHTLCLTTFSPSNDKNHYLTHTFKNAAFAITSTELEQHIGVNTFNACASADYVSHDYQTTQIEIVLETLFDDDRLHLTEKSLRPIACGHPFMLAATRGSLEYLRSYGFETFGKYIDENYDTVADPLLRLQAIISEMRRISLMSHYSKDALYAELRKIAERNKQLFFSKEWHDNIVNEYKTNLDAAMKVQGNYTFTL